MASERDFQLLDDYLSNKLSGQEKADFEGRMEADPDLKKELEFQQELVEGIKQARAAELKSMLNNIPISSIPSGQTSLITKVGSLVVIGGIVATGLYFYFSESEIEPTPTEVITPAIEEEKTDGTQPSDPKVTTDQSSESDTADIPDIPADSNESETKKSDPTPTPSPAKKPNITVYDPSKEASQEGLNPQEQIEIISNAFVVSSIKVEIDSGNKEYSFHYMFKDKKLVLFGIQEDDLYEILEFIYDDKRTVFLFYKSNYYWLDIGKEEPTKLSPIRDKSLLRKLKEHRGNN